MNATATTHLYTLSLHDALPISRAATTQSQPIRPRQHIGRRWLAQSFGPLRRAEAVQHPLHHSHGDWVRSEEHTSELQSRRDLVCRLLLEKKKKKDTKTYDNVHI